MNVLLLAGCVQTQSVESDSKTEQEAVKESTDIGEAEDNINSDASEENKDEEVSEGISDSSNEDISEELSDSSNENISDSSAEETEETTPSSSAFDFAGAFAEGQVYNNGGYFVKIRDKVYFRNIVPESMEKGATFGEFLNTEFYTMNCPIISYDVNTCDYEEIGTVAGTGELYACPEGFYIGETVPDMFDASCTNLYDPVTKEKSYFCSGLPRGVSESGKILAVDDSGGGVILTVLYKNGKECARIGGENIYYDYAGFAGETLITVLHNANEEYILCSVDESGEITELGMIGNSDHGYGVIKQFEYHNGYVYLCLGYYEGTGHFLSRWEVVKAKPGEKGSLEIAINGDDVPSTYEGEGPDPDVQIFYFDKDDTINCSEHVPYKLYMGTGDSGNDLLYYNDLFEECPLVKNFIDSSDYEKCSIIQDMESIDKTAFIIYADAEADSEYDLGWRTGYRMTGWHICAIPFAPDHLDEQGLAKEIIHFEK
ncbi:hypothetical protein [Butyrivibrio sp. AE3004]|uniref:hypothetical protein n=1 Tax=Butyrivibrio sp. AE3004 TaxID=1506994 RepID=UPI0018CC588E|nr:hypothetical protein [Butyrivibrio sp. AE3004]